MRLYLDEIWPVEFHTQDHVNKQTNKNPKEEKNYGLFGLEKKKKS